MSDEIKILDDVARTSIQLLLREPFYAHILACLNKQVVAPESKVKTLVTGIEYNTYVIYINPFFWKALSATPDIRYGLFKHELLHIIFKHPLVKTSKKDPLLVKIAMDLVVNQYIAPEQLPPDAIVLQRFPEGQFPPDQSWTYYYQQLEELAETSPGHPAITYIEKLREESTQLDRHNPWKEIAELSTPEKNLLEGTIDKLLERAFHKTAAKSIGDLPGRLQTYLQKLITKTQPLVDWRRILKIFTASSSKTRIKNTIQRPSKRYQTVPGIKVKRLRKLLIAVDTSGSISKAETQLFFHEIHHIWRQGTEIRIIECDADIQHSYDYRGQIPSFVSGGGDTSFEAPIRYGNHQFLPDGLIYFTDGQAPIPQIKARFPILWVISPDGLEAGSEAFRGLPGRKVKLRS